MRTEHTPAEATPGRASSPTAGASSSCSGSRPPGHQCRPFLAHRASWPHRGRSRRIIAQPSVWLKEPYARIDPQAALAVEQAILRGLGRPLRNGDGAMSDYVAVNRANWDSRVPHHLAAYGLELLVDDPEHLSGVVRFDRPRLGSVEGLDVVHLLESPLEGADKNGLSEVELTVGLANVPAVRLYESTGFSSIRSDGLSARMRRVLREKEGPP